MSSVTHFIRELTLFGSLGSAKGVTRVTLGFSKLFYVPICVLFYPSYYSAIVDPDGKLEVHRGPFFTYTAPYLDGCGIFWRFPADGSQVARGGSNMSWNEIVLLADYTAFIAKVRMVLLPRILKFMSHWYPLRIVQGIRLILHIDDKPVSTETALRSYPVSYTHLRAHET